MGVKFQVMMSGPTRTDIEQAYNRGLRATLDPVKANLDASFSDNKITLGYDQENLSKINKLLIDDHSVYSCTGANTIAGYSIVDIGFDGMEPDGDLDLIIKLTDGNYAILENLWKQNLFAIDYTLSQAQLRTFFNDYEHAFSPKSGEYRMEAELDPTRKGLEVISQSNPLNHFSGTIDTLSLNGQVFFKLPSSRVAWDIVVSDINGDNQYDLILKHSPFFDNDGSETKDQFVGFVNTSKP